MNARSVLQKMRAKYAALDSYQDQGCVVTRSCTIAFVTYFRRPTFFRFEWSDAFVDRHGRLRTSHNSIWSNGSGAYKRYDWMKVAERVRCLSSAVAGATGVSMGAAHTVAVMLMEEIGGFALSDLRRTTLSRVEFEGTPCYRVRGYHPHGHPYVVFLGRDDLLVRHVYEPEANSCGDREIRRDIRVNEPIDLRTFRGRSRA